MFCLASVWSVMLRLSADPGQRHGCMKTRSVTAKQHVGATKKEQDKSDRRDLLGRLTTQSD